MQYRGPHLETPERRDDLDVLYGLVADEFEVVVDGERLFREVDFPLVELAGALDGWLKTGLPQRKEFTFSPTGYAEPGALQFYPSEGDWTIDSSNPAEGAAPRRVETKDLEASVREYLDGAYAACAALGVDFKRLLDRMARYRTDPAE